MEADPLSGWRVEDIDPKSLAEACQEPHEILDLSDQVSHRLYEAKEIGIAERISVEFSHLYFDAIRHQTEASNNHNLAA